MTDKVTLLWHWDEELRLSFKWSGEGQDIIVEQGGFGEPEVFRLKAPVVHVNVKFTSIMSQFIRTCDGYADKVRNKMQGKPKLLGHLRGLDTWRDDEIQDAMRNAD
jgi:hypothetical protein